MSYAFVAAAEAHNYTTLQFFANHGADVAHEGVNALYAVCNSRLHSRTDHEEDAARIVDYLIGRGIDVDTVDSQGMSPLFCAVFQKQVYLVRALLRHHPDVNAICRCNDVSSGNLAPLHLAVERGDKEIVQLLLEGGASASVRNGEGRTPMDIAKRRQPALVPLLTKGVVTHPRT